MVTGASQLIKRLINEKIMRPDLFFTPHLRRTNDLILRTNEFFGDGSWYLSVHFNCASHHIIVNRDEAFSLLKNSPRLSILDGHLISIN